MNSSQMNSRIQQAAHRITKTAALHKTQPQQETVTARVHRRGKAPEAQVQVPVELQAQQTALPHPKKTARRTL